MEPTTEHDIHENYLKYHESHREVVDKFELWGSTGPAFWQLPYEYNLLANIPYQIVMARLHYRRCKEPIPAKDDINGLAQLYKKRYNTELGKATVEEAIKNYNKYCK